MYTGEVPDEATRMRRRLALLSSFARGLVCELDSAYRCCDLWTTTGEELCHYGMQGSEPIGRTLVELLGEEAGQLLLASATRVSQTGVPETCTYTLEARTFEARIAHGVVLLRDVTVEAQIERRRVQHERRAAGRAIAGELRHEISSPLMVIRENARTLLRMLDAMASDPAVHEMIADVLTAAAKIQDSVTNPRPLEGDDD